MVSVKAEQLREEMLVARRRYEEVPRSDTGRAEAFSDGVLAIVITLLVLHLKPPPIDAWVSWMIFFHVLFRHPELLEESVDETFFLGERVRAALGQPWRAVLHCAAALAHRARLRSHHGGQPPGRPGRRRALCDRRRDAIWPMSPRTSTSLSYGACP
ncbi:TMEM175 family protein [Streptomyces mirabilis]|uniref:TMEM175 family protein n=1 Tax=Streptomyces mirabilis TaxID=68239 RepID=UPI00368A3F0A